MIPGESRKTSHFSDRLSCFASRVKHICATNADEKSLAFRTRYLAYFRSGMINFREDGVLYDNVYDESDNGHITLSYIDDEFAATFRVHVGNSEHPVLPSLAVFPDAIRPPLLAGLTVVDPTRLAARLDASVKHPELPYVALRPAWLASEHYGADLVLATVAAEHAPFYRRVFGYTQLSEPRDYPELTFKVVCLGLDFEFGEGGRGGSLPVLSLDQVGARGSFRPSAGGANGCSFAVRRGCGRGPTESAAHGWMTRRAACLGGPSPEPDPDASDCLRRRTP